MRPAYVLGVFAVALATATASAAPSITDLQVELCKDGVVDKDKLVVHLMRIVPGSADALFLYPVKGHSGTGLPLVRALLSNANSCQIEEGDDCGEKANDAIAKLRLKFHSFVEQGRRDGTFVGLDQQTVMSRYFASSDKNFSLRCVVPTRDSAPAPTPNNDKKDENKLRLRGSSADLIYDRNDKEFDNASAATINLNDDRSSGKKVTTKVKAVVGYAYSIVDNIHLSKQIIPFVSINQTITDANGQRKLDDLNYVAGGTVFNLFYARDSGLGHSFSTTPQFLYNTKDRSQIASFRLDYKPYLNTGYGGRKAPLSLNWATLSEDGKHSLTLIFGLRSDIGYYVRKGDITDPNAHKSFGLIGTQLGFAWKLVDYRLTLKATEWLLYGYAGDHRTLDLFDGSIKYSLDPNDYFGLEFDYKRGRDLDTMDPIQQWTVAFTAKY